MERKYMAAYASYFLKFLQAYEAEGVPLQAVTIQNEVDTDQDARMPACIWPQEYEADFVRYYLGPLFERSGIRTKIWLIDHNYNLWGRAIGELETPDVRKYANAIAWHGYVGKVEWIERVLNTYPDAEMYWTEGGPDLNDPNYEKNWTDWSSTFTGILRNGCRSITGWNFALDEKGNPNIGPFHCAGLLTIDSQSREIRQSGQYWALAHFSRFVKRGAKRFHSEGADDLPHVAFENNNGKRVVIITNPTNTKRTIEIRCQEESASVLLGNNSLATLEWPITS
jgi:glucosylceramidase